MSQSNFERLIQLANDVFDVRNDPDQLDVDESVIAGLTALHPFSVSEESTQDGPIAWVLVIPTTRVLMEQFLSGEINEKQLFELTPQGIAYECIYLCSALVLEEHRRQGITARLTGNAIQEISKTNPIQSLFVWPFSALGKLSALKIADQLGLPIYFRN